MIVNLTTKNIYHLFNYLREGTILLLQSQINHQDTTRANFCFKKFLQRFSEIFGEYELTSNFHDLVHFPNICLQNGPLYEYSAFNFEHLNGRLKKLCKGNRRLDKQLIFKLHNLFKSVENHDENNLSLKKFIDSIDSRKMWKPSLKIDFMSFLCGKAKPFNLETEYRSLLPFELQEVKSKYNYSRAVNKSTYISTCKYDLNKKRSNSSFISKDKNFCILVKQIITFKLHSDASFNLIFADKYALIKKIF